MSEKEGEREQDLLAHFTDGDSETWRRNSDGRAELHLPQSREGVPGRQSSSRFRWDGGGQASAVPAPSCGGEPWLRQGQPPLPGEAGRPDNGAPSRWALGRAAPQGRHTAALRRAWRDRYPSARAGPSKLTLSTVALLHVPQGQDLPTCAPPPAPMVLNKGRLGSPQRGTAAAPLISSPPPTGVGKVPLSHSGSQARPARWSF